MDEPHPLKAWLENENTTQAQFARDLRCSESHISDILKGKKGVSLDLAIKISAATGVSVAEIAARMPGRAAA